VLKNCKWKEN